MPTLSPNQIETIYRDESYEAFLTTLPQQSEELNSQGFFDLFPVKEIEAYSTFRTHVYGSYTEESARNPGENVPPGTMAQGYNYWTAVRSEFSEGRSIPAEYLESTIKLKDYSQTQGEIQAKNYAQAHATYFTQLMSYGGILPATLTAVGIGAPGLRPRARLYAHYLKGEQGAVIAEIPKTDAAGPDLKAWFTYVGNEHVLANGDTSASYAGKTLGFFNAGSSITGKNMLLTETNLENALLHVENDLPWGPDRKFYSAPVLDTLIVSGNLRSTAAQIVDLNEYRLNTPNNDRNVMFRQSKVFGIKNIVVDRFLPDNCWYLAAKGHGVNMVYKSGKPGPVGVDGPVRGSISNIYIDMNSQTWVRQFFAYWSHWFDENMWTTWYAGSTPTALDSNNHPAAPTVASLVNWGD